MSDKDLRQLLNDIIDDFDAGRLRVVRRPGTVRNWVGSAVIAASLGLGAMACDSRSVGGATDAGVNHDAAAQVDGGNSLLYMAPEVDAGPMPEYAEPFMDAGIMPAYGEPFLDDGGVYEYMAPPVDAGDVPAYMAPPWDAGVSPAPDSGPDVAYGVPPVPPDDY